jgi:outer membrane lipoprotein SlyB
MAGEFDVTDIPFEDTTAAKEISKSVLSPDYRAPRGAFGAQEIGGLVGAIGGGAIGSVAGPMGAIGGSALGAGIGGTIGEAVEQYLRFPHDRCRRKTYLRPSSRLSC